MADRGATRDEPSVAGADVATPSTSLTAPGRPQESTRRSLQSSSLVRSLDLAVSAVLIVAVAGIVTTLLSIIGTAIPADQATGSYGMEAPIVANGPSVAELWYQMLGSLGGWILVAVGVMLLIVQPVVELIRRATPSRGLVALRAAAAVAVAGSGFGVLMMPGSELWTAVFGGSTGTLGSTLMFLVFGLVAYGVPVLIAAAIIALLTAVIGRRRVRIVTQVLAVLVVVAVIVASTGAFRPPPAQAVAAAQRTEAIDGFTDALADVDGVADIDVDGHGATVTMSLDAGVGQVLAAASAAKRVGDDLQGIAIVVIQREPDPTSQAQQQDPPRGPWRVQLVPSDRSIDEIADQLQRLMLTERLQVDIDVDVADGTPRVTVFSMEALPAAVRELRELYPDGASYSVQDRFSMVDDPSELSPAMVDAILAVVEAYPGVEIEVTTQPKLWITDVTPEQGAVIVAILQNPALAGTSPSGYPVDYSISTSGPDQDLEGTFG